MEGEADGQRGEGVDGVACGVDAVDDVFEEESVFIGCGFLGVGVDEFGEGGGIISAILPAVGNDFRGDGLGLRDQMPVAV